MRPILPAFNPAIAAQAEANIRIFQAGRADGLAGIRPRVDWNEEQQAEYDLGYQTAADEKPFIRPVHWFWKLVQFSERHRHFWHWS
jgi:hypothetical protein